MVNELKTCPHDYQRKPAWRAGGFAISGHEIRLHQLHHIALAQLLANPHQRAFSGAHSRAVCEGGTSASNPCEIAPVMANPFSSR
jgi:hypothetical protein